MNPFVPTVVLIFEEAGLNALPWGWGPVETFYAYTGTVAGTNLLLLLWKARSPYTLAAARLGWRRRRQRRAKPLRRTWFTRLLIRAGESGVPALRNPLFQKELRSEFFSRVRYRWPAFWLPFLIGGLILVAVEPHDDDWLEGVMQTTLFFVLLTRLKLRARTSLLAAFSLGTTSEFGLLVMALAFQLYFFMTLLMRARVEVLHRERNSAWVAQLEQRP